eukprot:m.10359 g.10359  ORF g.10359 m.10359 type:complete len:56 (+) comp22214_c0_seq1:204-371(+)
MWTQFTALFAIWFLWRSMGDFRWKSGILYPVYAGVSGYVTASRRSYGRFSVANLI